MTSPGPDQSPLRHDGRSPALGDAPAPARESGRAREGEDPPLEDVDQTGDRRRESGDPYPAGDLFRGGGGPCHVGAGPCRDVTGGGLCPEGGPRQGGGGLSLAGGQCRDGGGGREHLQGGDLDPGELTRFSSSSVYSV